MMNKTLYTITVYSENIAGMLNQITTIFTRRQINIESLSVSASSLDGIHKYTITSCVDEDTVERVIKQIAKRVDVIKAFYYTDDQIIYQEVAMYKILTSKLMESLQTEAIVRKYNARILEMNPTYTVLEKTGHTEETEALYEELKPIGLLQFVRSGRVAITKSAEEKVNMYLDELAKNRGNGE